MTDNSVGNPAPPNTHTMSGNTAGLWESLTTAKAGTALWMTPSPPPFLHSSIYILLIGRALPSIQRQWLGLGNIYSLGSVWHLGP